MNTLQITTGFKKELWEFKKTLIWVPIIIAIMMILAPVVPILLADNFQFSMAIDKLSMTQDTAHLRFFAVGVQSAMTAVFTPFIMVSLIIQLFYFTSCLFDERRDLSIFFWRSLPVSDAQTIATKLVTGALLIPAVFMLAATAVVLIALVLIFIASIVLSVGYDISLWAYWAEADIISNLASIWVNLLPYALWLFPIYAWLMLTSMFANKAPFLWAVLPVIVLLLIESFIVAYFRLNSPFISNTLVGYLQFTSDLLPGSLSSYESPKTALFTALSGKLSIIATLIGCGFMYLTYWLRINRSEG